MISRFVDRYERNTSTREEILQRVLCEVQAGERASRFGSCVARRLQVPQSSGVGRTSEDEGWRGKEGRRAVAGQRAGHAKIFSFATDTALLTRTGDQPQGDLLRLTAKSIPATPKFFTLTSPFFFFFFQGAHATTFLLPPFHGDFLFSSYSHGALVTRLFVALFPFLLYGLFRCLGFFGFEERRSFRFVSSFSLGMYYFLMDM